MKIVVFIEGTIITHKGTFSRSNAEVVWHVKEGDKTLHDFGTYIPIGNAVKKLSGWAVQGTEILYLTSRRKQEEIHLIHGVLIKYCFPKGQLLYRGATEEYKDIVEKIVPDILIEDDCESIGGVVETAITYVKPDIKGKIKSIVIKEFGGIDHLPDDVANLIYV